MRRFVDTNVLVYAACPNPGEESKRDIADHLLVSDELAVSVQVLQEFYTSATRPTRPGRLTPEQALTFLEFAWRLPVQDMTPAIFREAVAISRRFQIAYWDGAILAAARNLDCDVVYSEDLSHRQDYGGVRVVNPFADAGP